MSRRDLAYKALKWSLAIVFIWFGLLKLFGVSPVADLVFAATPFLRGLPYGFTLLAFFEVAVGVGVLVRRTASVSAALIIVHLVIASVAVLVHPMAWDHRFPLLSVEGEFVVKNAVLVTAAWLIAATERRS